MPRTTDTEPRTRPTDEIEPMVPIMPSSDIRTDGGRIPPRDHTTEQPPRTDHTTAYGRGTEEIEPMVPDLR
jgi:hypothetical protein